MANAWKNNYSTYKGSSAPTSADQARGDQEYEYLSPTTSPERRAELYKKFGARYGWAPLETVNGTAAAATGGTPATAVAPAQAPSLLDGAGDRPVQQGSTGQAVNTGGGTPTDLSFVNGGNVGSSTPQNFTTGGNMSLETILGALGPIGPQPNNKMRQVFGDGTAVPGANQATGGTFNDIIKAQQGSNLEAAQNQANLNLVGSNGPFGSVSFTKNDNGGYTQNTTLSPQMQSIVDALSAGELKNIEEQGLMLGTLDKARGSYEGYLGQPLNNFSTDRARIEDELFNKQKTWLDTQYGTAQDELMQRLANQGLDSGSEAYRKELKSFYDQKAADYTSAKQSAISQGGTEQQNMFNMALNARNQAYGEYQGLTGGVNTNLMTPQTPEAGQSPGVSVSPTDVTGTFGNLASLGGNLATNKYQIDTQANTSANQLANALEIAKLNAETTKDVAASGNSTDMAIQNMMSSAAMQQLMAGYTNDTSLLTALYGANPTTTGTSSNPFSASGGNPYATTQYNKPLGKSSSKGAL